MFSKPPSAGDVIGELWLGAAWGWPEFEWVLVNEIKGGVACAAHLMNFDSLQGRWANEAASAEGSIVIGDKRIAFTEAATPGEVPWSEHGVDIVLECSGKFRKAEDMRGFFERSVRKVIVAAPVKGGALNFVMGIITTIHDATNTQSLADRPDRDLRRARAAGLSLIPTTTGSATAIGLIYPELLGKLNGHVSIPIAVLIWLFVNWLVKPFGMAFLGWLSTTSSCSFCSRRLGQCPTYIDWAGVPGSEMELGVGLTRFASRRIFSPWSSRRPRDRRRRPLQSDETLFFRGVHRAGAGSGSSSCVARRRNAESGRQARFPRLR